MFWIPHFIVGVIISLLLYPIYGLNVWIILASNILIDADHYLWYIFGMKSFNLFRAFRFFKNRKLRLKYKYLLHIFHTAEVLIVLIVLSFYFEFFFLVLIGVVIHLILDVIICVPFKDCKDLKVWSFLEWFLVNGKIKK